MHALSHARKFELAILFTPFIRHYHNKPTLKTSFVLSPSSESYGHFGIIKLNENNTRANTRTWI